MKKTKISVIMATYNSEKFLNESIQSILSQTFRDFEFIIIDDCSTDYSLKIIKNYSHRDKRIFLIKNKLNLGRAKARNKGLKIADGEYIAILDSDDITLPERLEKQYNFLEKNKNIFLVGGGAYNIDEKGNIKSIKRPLTDQDLIKETLYHKNCIYHSTIMFKNEKNNFYRKKFYYSQDYDFYLRMLSKGKRLINIPDLLIKYRINPEAVSFSQKAKQRLFAEKAKEFYYQRLKYGKDIEESTNKIVLEVEIKASFKLNDFKRVRKFCRKYFKYYGFFNKIIIYFLLSFTGKRFIDVIRKSLFY